MKEKGGQQYTNSRSTEKTIQHDQQKFGPLMSQTVPLNGYICVKLYRAEFTAVMFELLISLTKAVCYNNTNVTYISRQQNYRMKTKC